MAWHILHGLLEQFRKHSTFPGKIWIAVMFIFRIVVVARIGEQVYHDEQSSFICNTLTPGCTNVCFNRFSPISHLRYWSLMVLVVAMPTILFIFYAMHIIYHADLKYPVKEAQKENILAQIPDKIYLRPPNYKRRKDVENAPRRRIKASKKSGSTGVFGSTTDNNTPSRNDYVPDFGERKYPYPIYNPRTHHVEGMINRRGRNPELDVIAERKLQMTMLHHPELFRAYWWHVVLRLILEVFCLLGQYYLYGWEVYELYECPYWPCPKTVDCFVSRPREKTCLLWLMYGLGVIATILSLCEFVSLGLKRVKTAFICCTSEESYVDRRKRLALLQSNHEDDHGHHGGHRKRLTSAVSLDSQSSETTIESV